MVHAILGVRAPVRQWMVDAILGVRAPVRQWAAGIPTVAWTIEGRVDRERVNLRSMSRRAGFLSEVAAALASSLITATLNQTALGRAGP
jgi:hypothetical protein